MIDRALLAAGTDPYRNLALEESLLERGFGVPRALLLYVDDPCAVVGRNQNPWAEVPEGAGLPVLRRVSGGGAVYHDRGNLNWSLIVPRGAHDREIELGLIIGALRDLGIRLEADSRGGLFVAGGTDGAGSKVSGTARRIGAERVAHHGTLLVDADLERLSRSLDRGIATEASRSLPSSPASCMNLAGLVPGLGVREVAEALVRALVGRAAESAEDAADRDFAAAAESRLRGWDWTWGATPPFSVAAGGEGCRAVAEVRGGRVASISGPGAERLSGFAGRIFDYALPRDMEAALAARDGGGAEAVGQIGRR